VVVLLEPPEPALPVVVVAVEVEPADPLDEAPPRPPEAPLDGPVLLSSPPHARAASTMEEKSRAKCFLMASSRGREARCRA
jgi:hypothetical protein